MRGRALLVQAGEGVRRRLFGGLLALLAWQFFSPGMPWQQCRACMTELHSPHSGARFGLEGVE
jgi:hypothetical protein